MANSTSKLSSISKNLSQYWLPRSYIFLVLLIYLVFLIDACGLFILGKQFQAFSYKLVAIELILVNFLVLIGLVALLYFRKWGIWLVIPASIMDELILGFYLKVDFKHMILGLTCVALLILLLHLGGKKSMWRAMK